MASTSLNKVQDSTSFHTIEVDEVYPFESYNEHYKDMSFSTRAIHVGMCPDPATGAVNPPIYMSSTFALKNPSTNKGYTYSRTANPSYRSTEMQIASLENGKYALTFASGISAVTSVAMMAEPGDNVLCFSSCYSGTYNLLSNIMSQYKINTTFIEINDYEQLISNLNELKPKILFFESPTNPLMDICDIRKVAQLSKEHECITAFDNTFSTPYHLNPLDLGVDIVMHSSTKYLAGHSDMLSGCIITNDKNLYESSLKYRRLVGLMPSPFESWLLGRSVKSLKVRAKQHSESAMKFSEYFSTHPHVLKVYYPGLTNHKDHKMAALQMKNGFGGMTSLVMDFKDLSQMYTFLENLKIFAIAISLGGIESLVNHSTTMTHSSIPDDVKATIGLNSNFLRVSIGLEDVEDLIYDFEQAIKKAVIS